MKTQIVSCLAAIIWLLDAPAALSQSTAFIYQGRVSDNGTNFTGLGQFKFALMASTSNVAATAVAVIDATGEVTSYFVSSEGSGYPTAPSVKAYDPMVRGPRPRPIWLAVAWTMSKSSPLTIPVRLYLSAQG